MEDCDYSFIALVDAEVKEEDKDENGMPTKFTYDVTSQKDILLATTDIKSTDTDKFGQPINFTFDHLLAKAKFTFTNGFSEDSGVELTVTDIKITDAPQKGKYGIDNNTWDVLSDKSNIGEVSFGNTEAILPNANGESGNVCLLLPGEYTFTISLLIKHNKGGSDTSKAMNATVKLESGHYYNFTAELNSSNVSGVEPIKFNITLKTEWGSDDEVSDGVDYEGEDVKDIKTNIYK